MTTLIVWEPAYHERRVYLDNSMLVRESISVERYMLGATKPNYPVPTIPLAVNIAHDVIQIAECVWFEGELFFELVYEY